MHLTLKNITLALLFLSGILAGFTGGGLYAQSDEKHVSSLGFFERMGTQAPSSTGNAEAAENADQGHSLADQSRKLGLADKVRAIVESDLDGEGAAANSELPPGTDQEDGGGELPPETDQEGVGGQPTKGDQLFMSAMDLYNEMNHKDAISAFVKLLNYEDVSLELEKKALIYLARIYYQMDKPLRVVSLLELYVDKFPDDPRREEIIFQAGKIYRELGQYNAAIAAFYRVLNAIIMAGQDDMQSYTNVARKAQFEIARTHFDLEEWAQALDLFERIALFELGDEDRETLRFYKAKSMLYLGRRGEGLAEIEQFAKEYPNSALLPELKYEKARAQIEMQHLGAGRKTLLDLIEMGGVPAPGLSDQWVEWRRIAGNFLANYYYKVGDYEVALKLYQSIIVMDDSPRWQLPIVMQMAGCFRRLEQLDRAVESFEFVIQEIGSMRERFGADALGPDLDFLENSAIWQLEFLQWKKSFDDRVQGNVASN